MSCARCVGGGRVIAISPARLKGGSYLPSARGVALRSVISTCIDAATLALALPHEKLRREALN